MSDQTAEQAAALQEAMRNLLGIVDDVSAATKIRNLQEEDIAGKKLKRESAAEKAGTGAALALTSLGKSILSTEAGMSKYNSSISAAGNAAMDVGKNFGLVGLAIGGFIKLLSMGAEAVMKQNDAMLKASDSLAEFGAAGTIGAKQIMDMGLAAGYSTEWLGKWTDVTKSLGTDIIGLSATVNGGVVSFAKLSKVTQDQLNGYQALGVSQEQLTKNQADYLKIQVQSGQQISKKMIQDGSLQRASLEYTNNLIDLSAITGLNLDQAKKAMELATSDLAVNTKLANLQDKELALRSQGKAGEAEADKIKAQINATKQFLSIASTTMDAETMAGLQSIVATGNFNELSAGLANGVPGILEFVKGIEDGSKKPEEFAKFMANATDMTRKNLGDAIMQNKDIAKSFAYSREALANAGKFRGKTEEEVNQMVKDDVENRTRILKEGTKDEQQMARNAQLTTEKMARAGVQELVGLINGPITNAFTRLQETLTRFGKGLAHWSDKILHTDIAKLFETPADIQANIAESAKDLAETQRKMAEAQLIIDKTNIGRGDKLRAADDLVDLQKKEIKQKEALIKLNDDLYKKQLETGDQAAVNPALMNTKVGTIGSMSPEESKAYAMTVAKRESGGRIGIENTLGFAGKYQFGAAALTDVGMLDKEKYTAMQSRGLSNKSIMNDPSVWKNEGGKAAFLKDEALQDKLFAEYTNQHYNSLLKANVLTAKSSKAEQAGYLMASHLKGVGGATALSKGEDSSDAYGAQTSEYYALGAASQTNVTNVPAAVTATAPAPVTPAPVASTDSDAIRNWAYSVVTGKATIDRVPGRLRQTVAFHDYMKNPPAGWLAPAPAVAQLSTGAGPAGNTPQPSDFAKASNDRVANKAVIEKTTSPIITQPKPNTARSKSSEINELLVDKLDIMIDKLSTSNDLQDKMLRYSHA